ncbi:MAG: hypothetical protein AAFP09_18530 [Cyanobacteria bacterium J06607_10]
MPDYGADPEQDGLVYFEYGRLQRRVTLAMDEQRPADPLQIADEQMRQLNDIDWLRQHPAAEIEGDGWVEAGNGLQPYVAALKRLSPQDMRTIKAQARVLSMLLPVLRDWMAAWELGASFEAAYIEAQGLLFQQIQTASVAQERWFEELSSAYKQGTRAEYTQAQLRKKLAEILTQENWQALAKVATQDMEKRILQHAQMQVELPTAV